MTTIMTPSMESAIPGTPARRRPMPVMAPTQARAPSTFQVVKRRWPMRAAPAAKGT